MGMRAWMVAAGLAVAAPAGAQVPVASEPAAVGCVREHSPQAMETFIDPTAVDAHLLDRAMRMEVNYHRCAAGVAPVMEATPLAAEAARHALNELLNAWRLGASAPAGRETPAARAGMAGFSGFVGENTGWFPWLDMEGGSAVRDASLGACGFTGATGIPVPAFTYARFAQASVDFMMRGGESHTNIIEPRATAMGTGVAHGPEGPQCGTLFVVQMLAE